MDLWETYRDDILRKRSEQAEEKRQLKLNQEQHLKEMPNFNQCCKKITKFRAATLLNKVYKARQAANLPPFTHTYDYKMQYNCWLAKEDFRTVGRYGSKSNDIVFVPNGICVTCHDHTVVIYYEDWNRNPFVPAYSNTV